MCRLRYNRTPDTQVLPQYKSGYECETPIERSTRYSQSVQQSEEMKARHNCNYVVRPFETFRMCEVKNNGLNYAVLISQTLFACNLVIS